MWINYGASTDGGIVISMNTLNNPKLVAFVQTVFYGAMFAIIPIIISSLGVDGFLYSVLAHILPQWVMNMGVTAALISILNYAENAIQAKTGKAMFGSID